MKHRPWTVALRQLYDKAISEYRSGNRDPERFFTRKEHRALSRLGLRPINLYDYAEDFLDSGEPDWETVVLIVAARRDYFLSEQKGKMPGRTTPEAALPRKEDKLGGISWLPRLIRKAECFLHGSLCPEIMYCCGGDRSFLRKHNLHPADFLRVTWHAGDDHKRILRYVRTGTLKL